jgi:predicted amino acid-binding ACT domain protein
MGHALRERAIRQQLEQNERNIARIEIAITRQWLTVKVHSESGIDAGPVGELLKTFQETLALYNKRRESLSRDLRV